MTHAPTVTAHFSRAVAEAAQRLGLQVPDTWTARPDACSRVSLAWQDRLWEQFCERADDPLAGVELGLALEVGHLDVAGLVLMSCSTVSDAMDALIRYEPIIGEGSHFRIRDDGIHRSLCYEPVYRVCRDSRVEATMASLFHLIRWGTGGRFRTSALAFRHAPRAMPASYRERIGLPVSFDAADNAIVFRRDQLQVPLVHANPSLCAYLRTRADELLERLDGDRTTTARVATLVGEHPRWGKERVASQLGISGRQLARQLRHEGTGFKSVRCHLLRVRAERALDAGLRPTRVAEQLGFPDESAFAKAFRRWTGHAPSERHRR